MSGKIVFVIGAGTGPDIGMPLGDKLRMEIRRVLRVTRVDYVDQFAGDEKIRDAIEELVRDDSNDCDFGSYFSACKQIANSMPLVDSIDEYLDMHRDDKVIEIISKLAIVRCILADEANSDFKFDLKVPGALMDTAGLEKSGRKNYLAYSALVHNLARSRVDFPDLFLSTSIMIDVSKLFCIIQYRLPTENRQQRLQRY